MKKIYLLPGLMTDERLWCRLKPLLEKEYELIHIPIPLVDDFKDVSKVIDKVFKEDKVNLLGFSLGSYIASYYAINYPHRVNKLFLVSGSASFINKTEIEKREEVLKQMQNFGFKGLSEKKVKTLIEKSNYEDKELIKTIKDMFSDLGFDVYKKQMELSFKRVDISQKLSLLDIPIKLFYSSDDRLFDYKALEKLKVKKSEKISFVEREGQSHMIPLEKPEALIKEIKIYFKD